MNHSSTDARVRRIGPSTWIDQDDKYVFEVGNDGIDVFNLRKGPGQQPALNEESYDTLDDAIAEYLGDRRKIT